MNSVFSFVVSILTAALALLGFVHANPQLPHPVQNQVTQVAQQAGTQTNIIATNQLISPAKILVTFDRNSAQADANASIKLSGTTNAPATNARAELNIVIIGPNYTGSTDWVSVGNLDRTVGSAYVVQINTASITSGASGVNTWQTAFYPVPAGHYQILAYDPNNGEALITFKTLDVGVQTAAQGVSVRGMQKYTDADFGFSFWYPSGWSVRPINGDCSGAGDWGMVSTPKGGTGLRCLVIRSSQSSQWPALMIGEITSPSMSLEVDTAKTNDPLGIDERIYFDKSAHTWMGQTYSTAPNGNPPSITPLDTSNNTIGGLHIFGLHAARFNNESVIPLSAHNFVIVSNGGGMSDQSISQQPLVQTILALDPSVATPLDSAQQEQAIHAEDVVYGALARALQGGWFEDANNVYDEKGSILPGADPATFSNVGIDIGKDKSHVYMQAQVISGADPNTFVMTGIAKAKDVNHMYDWEDNHLKIDGVLTSISLQ